MLPAMSTTSPGIPWPRRSGRERGLALNLRRFKDSAPLAALLIFAGAVYLWGLSRNGYANSYYAAAVQAGTHSWKAFLFGSLDASNYITVDKPPASLWLMEISSRVFGFSSFSMLLPQALAGVAAGALVLSAGWWVALVELWPASSRPYIGGSTDNSILQLIFGYNGLDRISSAGAGPGGGFSGSAGVLRLFNSELGGQISWLLPAATIALVAGAVWTVRRERTDRHRTALLLWGGWFAITALVFSFMTGVIHPYYTNMLAPAIAVLIGVGATVLWQQRERLVGRMLLAAMLAATAVWSYILLDRSPHWHPWLRFAILIGGALAVVGI